MMIMLLLAAVGLGVGIWFSIRLLSEPQPEIPYEPRHLCGTDTSNEITWADAPNWTPQGLYFG